MMMIVIPWVVNLFFFALFIVFAIYAAKEEMLGLFCLNVIVAILNGLCVILNFPAVLKALAGF